MIGTVKRLGFIVLSHAVQTSRCDNRRCLYGDSLWQVGAHYTTAAPCPTLAAGASPIFTC